MPLLEEVLALLEDVCYLKGVVLIFQVIKPGLVVYCSFLLPEDAEAELSAPLQHHVCLLWCLLHLASCHDHIELNLCTVSKCQLNFLRVAMLMMSLHSNGNPN